MKGSLIIHHLKIKSILFSNQKIQSIEKVKKNQNKPRKIRDFKAHCKVQVLRRK